MTQTLTVGEFEQRYGDEKPHFEFWHGLAVQKRPATWLHGLLQRILMELLVDAGYKAASEVKLKIAPEFQPVPDVIATRERIETPYPTKALEVVIEILSNDDPMARVLTKCRTYQSWGFRHIYVVDPESPVVFRWADHKLEEVDHVASIAAERVWVALDKELA